MTTTTVTESFYAQRIRKNYDLSKIGKANYRWWFGKTRFSTMQEIVQLSFDIHEETYAGFQLVIVEHKFQHREVLDSNGQPFSITNRLDTTLIGGLGEIQYRSDFYAYAWKIGDVSDQFNELAYADQFAVLGGICGSTSLKKTRTGAIAKLKILSEVEAIKDTLISICDERMYASEKLNPYNATIGDQVFVYAHGRLRKGVITSTTGSRFVVGYVTPSNHEDLKYKVVHLAQIYVKEIA